MNWQPIETAPQGHRPFPVFVVIAIGTTEASTNITYTSDPYCVWRKSDGSFARWPHYFPPTHWLPLPPLMTKVTCSLTKEISVQHVYDFERDDKGAVTVTSYYKGVKAESSQITIPRDCIQPFINTLEQFK